MAGEKKGMSQTYRYGTLARVNAKRKALWCAVDHSLLSSKMMIIAGPANAIGPHRSAHQQAKLYVSGVFDALPSATVCDACLGHLANEAPQTQSTIDKRDRMPSISL